jgi:hypothetical protein
MKYLLIEINGVPSPILFPDHVPHKVVAGMIDDVQATEVKSAGFVKMENGKLQTYGYSEGLRLTANPVDVVFIESMFGEREDCFEVVPKLEGVR